MNDGFISAKSLAEKIYKKEKSFFRGEKYNFWILKREWGKIVVDDIIAQNSDPINLFDGKLIVEVYDHNVKYFLNTYMENIIQNINKYIGIGIVNDIEVLSAKKKKLNRILADENDKKETKDVKIEKEEKKEEEKIKFENIVVSQEEIEEIDKNIEKINSNYSDFAEKLREIAIKMKKRDKYLLTKGYKICEECETIFFPKDVESVCFECYGKKEAQKLENMKNLIRENPYISEKEAIRKTQTDDYTYYKARDILAQQMYDELVYFCEKTNVDIEINKDYSSEIRNEAKIDLEIYIKYYIDYRIGTNDKQVFMIERRKIMKKLKRELEFRGKLTALR